MKKFKLLLSFVFLMVICPLPVANAATFVYGTIFSEYRHYEPPFTNSGFYYMLSATGVDTNSYPVYVQNIPGTSGNTLLFNLPGWDDLKPFFNYVKGFGSPVPGGDWENRTYTFYIDLNQNGQKNDGEPTTTWDIPQNSIFAMALVQNVSISAGYNPTITWDPAPNADSYRVRFFPVKQDGNPDFSDLLFESDVFSGSSSYSFTYTGTLFNDYDSLAVVIEAWEDYNDQILNRSRHIVQHAPGATGRALLFNHGNPTYSGLLAANQKFEDALSADPNNQEANLFYAVTRIGAFALEEGSGAGLETLRDIFHAFGMTRNSNEFFEDGLPYDTPPELPGNSPRGEAIRQFLAGPYISLLNGALANIENIGTSFHTTLTADETGDEAVEVDYGDVLLLKSILQAFKATLWVISAYDIDLDPVQIADNLNNHPFNINTDLINPNPEFLKLLSGGGTTLKNAETDIIAAINSYDAASTFIRSESDNQEDDLITLDPEETTNETGFRDILDRIKDSLENNYPVEIGDDALRVDFSEFFDDPISIRDHLPSFIYNACMGDYKGVSSFPDTTLSGIFPDGLPPDIEYAALNGDMVTQDLWIRAVINTEEKGPIEAVWKKGGEDTTSRGDRVIWGHFYACPSDVTWGNQNNPDLFAKIWFDVSGRVDVNFFHVSVPDIEVYSDYPYDGTADEQGTTTMSRRYIRQYYQSGQSYSDENYEDGNPPSGYSPAGNPSGFSTINNLRIGSLINTVEKGPIDAVWQFGGQDTTSRGDQVVWGHFYASPSDVTWGSSNNPDLFVKIWFDVSGRVDVNYFHVSVPDIEVYSDLPSDSAYDQQGTTIMDNRYIRHEY